MNASIELSYFKFLLNCEVNINFSQKEKKTKFQN